MVCWSHALGIMVDPYGMELFEYVVGEKQRSIVIRVQFIADKKTLRYI